MNITLKNKSLKAFNILKAGSILDDNRLESMRLDGGNGYCAVGFADSETPPHTNPRDESEFQLMPAYGKITTTIDLLDVRDAYKFCGNGTAVLSIKATIHAAEVGNTTLVHEIPYELRFAAVYHKFFPPLPKVFEERVHKCSPDYLSVLKEGITNCASLATAAREAALNGSAERMEAYFKDSSQDTRNSVADVFAKVAAMCNFENSRVYYTCNHWVCGKEFAGVLRHSDPGHVAFCKRGYYQPMLPDFNEVSSVTHTIIHEMTHLDFVKATKDLGYGLLHSTDLVKDESLQNADSYALFSDAVYLKEDGLNQTRADAAWQSTKWIWYDSNKLGNLTRSEFLSLPPAVRSARFGFVL
ncbi:deuterolysin metalloprotease [Beauveria bassiana ARSEF 2860]|uniref:deuterolysin n=1 Tax=Beauveria bassiana (strain ARSEF 2860) TaxID=655819 RepID=J4VZW1_BEAB2|nr:deuterolysin metalloprotease [Beauveria bassiana ARSEF 2860]EJP63820.1 deuterolysin metalloprotease [Beauveria bassiana ARSEF 2860]